MTLPAAILDVDGTLVDTNYHHVLAWARAFASCEIVLPLWRIHRHMGMGADKLLPALLGETVAEEVGETVRQAERGQYLELIDEVRPFPGARPLLEALKRRGHPVVLASSAKEDELNHYLDLLDAREIADGWTTSADVEATKPEPDLVLAALEKAGRDHGVMIGDSPWDCEAAKRARIDSVALLTGGFSEQELLNAGAACVFESLETLQLHLDQTPLAI